MHRAARGRVEGGEPQRGELAKQPSRTRRRSPIERSMPSPATMSSASSPRCCAPARRRPRAACASASGSCSTGASRKGIAPTTRRTTPSIPFCPTPGTRRSTASPWRWRTWRRWWRGSRRSRTRAGSGAGMALRFLVLTAARTSEAIGARWSEIDLDHATWFIPAARMKGGEAHRVPLAEAAVAVLAKARARWGSTGLVFRSARGTQIDEAALRRLLRHTATEATVHGFRGTFKSWCMETGVSRELAELSLAHTYMGGRGSLPTYERIYSIVAVRSWRNGAVSSPAPRRRRWSGFGVRCERARGTRSA